LEKKRITSDRQQRIRIFLLFPLLGFLSFLCITLFFDTGALGKEKDVPFVPRTPLLQISEVRPGMKGVLKTVISGTSVQEIPVEILSVISRKEKPHNLILLKAFGPLADALGGIASGMSGSPVYVEGKLVGAIGYGWEFSDHHFALATSIEDMINIWDQKFSKNPAAFPEEALTALSFDASSLSGDMSVSQDIFLQEIRPKFQVFQGDGFSSRSKAELEQAFSLRIEKGLFEKIENSSVSYEKALSPGKAMGALLAWGDVSLGAIGTVSAVDAQNRFLAFAHPFLNRGLVAYPVSTAYIHSVIPSVATPFKLGSMGPLIGIMTRDTSQGVGGIFQVFAPSVSFEVTLKMPQSEKISKKRFHVVNDPYLVSGISGAALLGILDNLWGRKGEGTAFVTFKVDRTPSFPGWQREDMFFSDEDIAQNCLKDSRDLIRVFTTNPFLNIFPLGFSLEIEILENPRILYIEDVVLKQKSVQPGEKVEAQLSLRPYRGNLFTKSVSLTVPEDYEGSCEVIVRGGGIAEMEQEAVLDGWKTIASMDRFLKELDVMESNNEIVVELLLDEPPSKEEENPHPFLSNVITSKIDKEEMRIFRTNYYVEGLLRRKVQVKKEK